jgi:hypothetical protein
MRNQNRLRDSPTAHASVNNAVKLSSPTRVIGRPFVRGNKFGKGRVSKGHAKRTAKFDALAADLLRINPTPLSTIETTLLTAAVESWYVSRLKKTHAAERQQANFLRTIARLMDARIATKGSAPVRMTPDDARAVASIFNGGGA